jgi:hypothetical protein
MGLENNCLENQQAHLQFAQANAQTKNCKRACFPTRLKIVFSLSKKNKKYSES